MSLDEALLSAVADVVGAAPTLREAVAQWRARHPEVRAVLVDPEDMSGETPALRVGGRSVYFAASNGHCWAITQQAGAADALILTEG
jgi:hypothetical protein